MREKRQRAKASRVVGEFCNRVRATRRQLPVQIGVFQAGRPRIPGPARQGSGRLTTRGGASKPRGPGRVSVLGSRCLLGPQAKTSSDAM